jgi:NADH:ubiquinone oxidoreductase subunit F (NADH-binding)
MSTVAAFSRAPAGVDRLLSAHDHGPLPCAVNRRERSLLVAEIEASGLTGRGGAGFPTAVKLSSPSSVLVANGTEGEPASWKDKVLLASNPHLVIDGAVAAAGIVGARQVIFAVGRASGSARKRLAHALRERDDGLDVVVESVPDRFVAGEESALVAWLDGRDAKPTMKRPYERGLLVQNVETLANVGLVARYGAVWYRKRGTAAEPGTVLVTVLGAVKQPGVVEVELGTPVRDVLQCFGGLTALPQAILVGGYFGTWVRARDVYDRPFTNEALQQFGASLGARTLAVLPQDACGLAESARVARYLAAESAGQCGPCVFGLPAMADALERLDVDRLRRLVPQVSGRGACAHPTGASRFVASAVDVFADEIERHRSGRCCGPKHPPLLPVEASEEWR